ncbi:MBL fold metallo-hydrolase [Rheinheimera baltica]|uniref:MBL fold metallo-hydrolase n=1 Tax=Rheinheimera baltica TaxID=67576 RepID=UPI00273EFC20|nr:MBL fold metallo-hydrolase [Rheinheimera baltica]MDP5143680.1 MBL fold metallo-hydrolase [Rheinheimera baltica]
MKLTFVLATTLLGSLMLLSACSTSNTVQQLNGIPDNAADIVKNKAYFQNMYRGDIPYPANCEQDCYLPHPLVECQTPAEQCRYTGAKASPELKTGFSVHWLGHASFSINTPDGQQLLLDPVTGQFDWPVNWAAHLFGTKARPTMPELSPEQLAATDAVLYSHLHYDHFSTRDIKLIGTSAHYYLPYGMAAYMPNGGYQVTEMAWYSSAQQGKLTIDAVPARHFNSRTLSDENQALWAGWLIQHGDKKLFFAGDTGYSQHFNDIRQRYGVIDICLLPIASYHGPNYRAVHMTPEDALMVAEELGCKVMIPWGYGNASWQMGDHSSHSPLLRLLHMQQRLKSKVPLLILNEGDRVAL